MGAANVKNKNMATPWTDPRTGRLYLRQQIPLLLRPTFGGRSVYKITLGTKDVGEAKTIYARENLTFENQLSNARRCIANGRFAPSPAGLVKRWFEGPAIQNGLPGSQRLVLVLMELDSAVSDSYDDKIAGDPVPSQETD